MIMDGMLLIRGGLVIDGTGRAGRVMDVLIAKGRIEALGSFPDTAADECIDANGRIVCPGFIDPHNHADSEVMGGILQHPHADNLLRQGITTVIANQCGGATFPIAPFLDRLGTLSPCINVGMLASHGRARSEASRLTGAAPGPELWTAMDRFLRQEMEAGAFGVTTGIVSIPKSRIPTEELIAAGRAVAPYGGIYASHIRDEGEKGDHLDAIGEVYAVAREAGIRGHVSHLKLWGYPNWGHTDDVLAIFDRAVREGVLLSADQYPYIGGYRGFYSLMWQLAQAPTKDDAWRAEAEAEVERQLEVLGGPDRLIISAHESTCEFDGRTIREAGDMLGIAPAAVVPELYLRNPRPALSAFFLAMQEEDVRVFMCSPHTMAGTDSHVRVPGSGASHPRNYGVYPRLLGKYVREEGLMSWEAMIHRMTAKVADTFGIRSRGRIAEGCAADVVIFDPERVRDRSTWKDGYAYPVGVEHVIVNGGLTVRDERFLGVGYGRPLRRTDI